MKRAAIVGLGQVSAAGVGVTALADALAEGAPPEPDWLDCSGSTEMTRIPLLRPDAQQVRELFDPRAVRRLDRFSLCAAGAASAALADAGLDLPEKERLGVILATGLGAIETSFHFLGDVIDKGDRRGSPILFARSVHGAPTSTISSLLDVRGPTTTITRSRGAWAEGLWLGLDWLKTGLVDALLLCAADGFHEVLGYGLLVDGGYAEDGRMRPLSFERASFVPGEVFSAMLLARPGRWPARWGEIDEPSDPSSPHDLDDDGTPVLLAAEGRLDESSAYRAVAERAGCVDAPAALWGGAPTAEAMTVVAGALRLGARGRTEAGGEPERSLRCCAAAGAGTVRLVRLHAP